MCDFQRKLLSLLVTAHQALLACWPEWVAWRAVDSEDYASFCRRAKALIIQNTRTKNSEALKGKSSLDFYKKDSFVSNPLRTICCFLCVLRVLSCTDTKLCLFIMMKRCTFPNFTVKILLSIYSSLHLVVLIPSSFPVQSHIFCFNLTVNSF